MPEWVPEVARSAPFQFLAGLASIAGVVFSLLAWRQATSASTAAQEARRAVVVRNTVTELQLASARAQLLLDNLIHKRYSDALTRSDDLLVLLSDIPYRRSAHLDMENKDALLKVNVQLEELSKRLTEGGDVPEDDHRRMVNTCRKHVLLRLQETLGKVHTNLD